jgi:GNAT superfamily N-acetyltransferase
MPISYREFEGTDADYDLLVEMINAEKDGQETVEQVRFEDKEWYADVFQQRDFVMLEGKCIGETRCLERPFPGTRRRFFARLSLVPTYRDRGFEEEIFARLVTSAERAGASTLTAGACDDQAGRIEVLERMGFRLVGRHTVSRLDLEEFDGARLSSTSRAVEEQGIVIRTEAELEDAGVDWLPLVHDLYVDVLRDMQIANLPTFEEFRERHAHSPLYSAELSVVAFDGERAIGSSNLVRTPGKPDLAATGFTCVRKSHARRGIAAALKSSALGRSRQAGIRFVSTANEENNPMLQLNIRLGFRHVYAERTYRKELTKA